MPMFIVDLWRKDVGKGKDGGSWNKESCSHCGQSSEGERKVIQPEQLLVKTSAWWTLLLTHFPYAT